MPVLPEYSLAGRVAILATSGGEEAPVLAQALAEAGSAVFVVARRQDSLEAVLKPLSGLAGTYGGVVAEASTASGLAEAMRAFDQIPPSPSAAGGQRGVGGISPAGWTSWSTTPAASSPNPSPT